MGQNKKHQLTGRYVNLMNLKNFMLNERSQSQNCIHCMYILYVCTYSYMKFKNRQNQITVIGSAQQLSQERGWGILGKEDKRTLLAYGNVIYLNLGWGFMDVHKCKKILSCILMIYVFC